MTKGVVPWKRMIFSRLIHAVIPDEWEELSQSHHD